ncbi:MAG TPA: aldehyde dehydrogenase family protein [Candidatus Dormibacteraeota bacterium]|jgi:phenylacetaldehyde dehydrogenase|nr:aldehyde dehydrogenase family protein [Candidatus Dormibacteraeota bacterium]
MSDNGHGLPRALLHIGGEDVPARGGATDTVTSPASGSPVAEVADGGPADAGRAADAAARIVCGGDMVSAPGLKAGNAIAPTVVEQTAPGSEIATQEVFRPVATFIPFDREEEATELANGTEYGLSASLWTRDLGRALRVSREIRSGLLSVNSDSSSCIQAPFGGRGRSGMGREQGIEGLLEFTDVKNVFISDR